MIRRLASFALLFAAAALAHAQQPAANPASTPAETATGTEEARFGLHPAPLDFKPPQVNHAKLANGITLDHYADPAIGLVTIIVRVATGSVDDPPGKVGVAELTGAVVRSGGTTKMDGDAMDRNLEAKGASLSVATDREATTFVLSVLKEDLPWGMQLLRDLLSDAALPESKLDEARERERVSLQQRLDVPQDLARALFPMLLYGRDNAWAWTDTTRTLSAIKLDDVKQHFKAFYTPRLIKVGLAGAVDWAQAQQVAGSTLGAIAAEDAGNANGGRARASIPVISQSRVYIVPRDVTQNVIFFGHEGLQRFDASVFPSKIYNNVISGGFNSRLLTQVRSDRGLAYSVGGRIGDGTVRGIYSNVALTKVESTGEALTIMRKIAADMIAAPPTDAEMSLARDVESNGFVFNFDTAEKIVNQRMTLDAFGFPADYLQTYLIKLRAATPQDVQKAAAAATHPEKMIYLVVGKVDAALRKELEALGPITEISDDALRSEWL